MAVAVSNTALDLANKTLLKTEDAQTIVGLKTFDLGLAAPFGVGPGAAMVVNLDAEKVGGETKAQLHDAALLTGTIAPASLPNPLPELNGAFLLNLNASQLAFGFVPVARVPIVVGLADAASLPIDASLGNTFSVQAAGDRTIQAPTNPTNGQKIIIAHLAVGADRTLTLTGGQDGFRFGTDIPGLTPTLNGKVDYIGCIYNGYASGLFWDVVAYSKGY